MNRISHSALVILTALLPGIVSAAEAGEERMGLSWAEISVRSDADPAIYRPNAGMLLNPEHCEEIWIDEYSTFSVPSGSYTLIYNFMKYGDDGFPMANIFCIEENIKVKDGDVIDIDPSRATHRMRISPLREDGEAISLPRERIIVPEGGGEPTTEILSEGNSDFCAYSLSLHHPEYGSLLPVTMKSATEKECYVGENRLFALGLPGEVLMTPVSDEWKIFVTTFYGSGNDLCFAILDPSDPTDGDETGSLTNAPGEFTDIPFPTVVPSYQAMLVDNDYSRMPLPRVLVRDEANNYNVPTTAEIEEFMTSFGEKYSKLRVYPSRIGLPDKRPTVKVSFECVDLMTMQPDTVWLDDENFEVWAYVHRTFTTTPPIVLTADGCVPLHNLEESYYQNEAHPEVDPMTVCRHEWVPGIGDIASLSYAATPVYMPSFISGSHNGWGEGLGLRVSTLDYFGAYTSTLTLNSDWSLDYNGRPLWIDKEIYILPDFYAYDRDMQGAKPGTYTLRMTSAEERVDGLEAHTTITATIDQTKADDTAPAIHLMNFVDSDGFLTHEFALPETGRLRLAAGDFIWDADTGLPVAVECLPIVEVTPYGDDTWIPLSPERRYPECSPTFAPAYEVKLDDVATPSPTGWFNLRISMTDPSGNSMTQTISPAFRIESLAAGISDAVEDGELFRIDGRDIIAREDARIYTVGGQLVGGRNLQPGVYIVAGGGESRKVFIR